MEEAICGRVKTWLPGSFPLSEGQAVKRKSGVAVWAGISAQPSPCSVFNGCSPLPSSCRAKGGHGQGVSPALRSSSYRGSRKSQYPPHSLRQQKRMLEKRSSRGKCKDKGTGKVSRANRLSSKPPQAGRPGTPRGCSPNSSCKLQSPTQCLEDEAAPQGLSQPCLPCPYESSLSELPG